MIDVQNKTNLNEISQIEFTLHALYFKLENLNNRFSKAVKPTQNPHVNGKEGFNFQSYTEFHNSKNSTTHIYKRCLKDFELLECASYNFIQSLQESECEKFSNESLEELKTLLSHEYKNIHLKPKTELTIESIGTTQQDLQRIDSQDSGYKTSESKNTSESSISVSSSIDIKSLPPFSTKILK